MGRCLMHEGNSGGAQDMGRGEQERRLAKHAGPTAGGLNMRLLDMVENGRT